MKLRAQLIVAFVLLSVLPLTGIVLFSYWTSRRAMEATLEAEADAMTRDMEQRLVDVRSDLERGVRRVGTLLMRDLAQARGSGEALGADELNQILAEMGENANMIESFTVLPAESAVGGEVVWPHPADGPPRADSRANPRAGGHRPPRPPRPPGPPAAWVVDVQKVIEEATKGIEEAVVPEARVGVEVGLSIVGEMMRGGWREILEEAEVAGIETSEDAEDARQRRLVARREARELRFEAMARRIEQTPEALEDDGQVVAPMERELELLGMRLDTTVRDGDIVMGRVAPKIRREAVIGEVLARTDRVRGEVPFAFDAEGTLFTANDADRERLATLALAPAPVGAANKTGPRPSASTANAAAVAVPTAEANHTEPSTGFERRAGGSVAQRLGDWLIVQSVDPRSGLRFGIARPLGDSLDGVRRAALHNFLAGLGLIAVALLGIIALSRRMTRNLELVTVGAERVAAGDLDTTVPVRSRDEIGQLAGTFNRMAHDLRDNQARLVEQELDQRVLEVELAHKNDELEEARRFQLAMLPSSLPEHPRFEVAVAMRTATEVGGDYYDFRQEGQCLTVGVGDATGHGATAGRMVTVVKTLLNAHDTLEDPASFLTSANTAVRRMGLGRMAMAMALARFEGDRFTWTAAGMPPALIHRAATGAVDELTATGMPLGGLESAYPTRAATLASGDTVLLMSDGYPELPSAHGDPVGYDAVRHHFGTVAGRAMSQEVVDALLDDVAHRTGHAAPPDDVTFVVIKVR